MPGTLANALDLVEIEDIRKNTVILKNGSLRQVLIVGGINFALKSTAEQTVLLQSYQNFLNGLNFPIQISIHSRKINIEKYLGTLEERRTQEVSGLLQDQIGEYEEFIRGFVRDNAIMAKMFLTIVSFTPVLLPSKETVMSFIPFLRKKGGAETPKDGVKEADFEENLAQLTQRVNQVKDGLATIGIEAMPLNDQQLIELFYNFYNPETTEKEGVVVPPK